MEAKISTKKWKAHNIANMLVNIKYCFFILIHLKENCV